MQIAGFILLGYLSGSVLYARVFARLFGKEEMIENSRDRNPGTANAFMYGGFWCGLLTLICDIGKAFIPVFLFMRAVEQLRPMWMGRLYWYAFSRSSGRIGWFAVARTQFGPIMVCSPM